MELFLGLDPALLPRFRAQPILKAYRLGRSKTSSEQGVLFDSETLALRKRGISVTILRRGRSFVESIQRGEEPPSFRRVATQDPPAAPADQPDLLLVPIFDYRLTRAVSLVGGPRWQAEMTIEQGDVNGRHRRAAYCRVSFRLLDGNAAPLIALLQALAEKLPLRLMSGRAWTAAFDCLRDRGPQPVKAKLPPLPEDCSNRQALRLIAHAGLEHLLANQDSLFDSGDPEAIHQMRVALRRLRSALSLFKPMLNDPQSQALRAELRWMQQTLGGARDGDVLLTEIVQPLERLYQFTPGYEGLVERIEQMRQAERQAMLKEVAAPRFGQSLLRLACWIEEAGQGQAMAEEPVKSFAQSVIDRRYRQLRKRMADFLSLDEIGRHLCRIQAKKLRYAIEFFGKLMSDRGSQKFIAELAALQDGLGHLNDIAVGFRILQRIGQQAEQAETAFVAGLVAGWHQNSVGDMVERAWDQWHEVEKLPRFWKDDKDGVK